VEFLLGHPARSVVGRTGPVLPSILLDRLLPRRVEQKGRQFTILDLSKLPLAVNVVFSMPTD